MHIYTVMTEQVCKGVSSFFSLPNCILIFPCFWVECSVSKTSARDCVHLHHGKSAQHGGKRPERFTVAALQRNLLRGHVRASQDPVYVRVKMASSD